MWKCGVFFTATVLILSNLLLLVSSFTIGTINDGSNNWTQPDTFCENGCEGKDLLQNISVNSGQARTVENDLKPVASIPRNCGADDICIPNLHLQVEQIEEQHYYEVDKPFVFRVNIQNSGEDAYETKFYLQLPEDFGFIGTNNTDEELPFTGSCIADSGYKSIIVCDIGDPVISQAKIKFDVIAKSLKNQKDMQERYYLFMNVTGLNDNLPGSWNQWTAQNKLSVDIFIQHDLKITGQSTPEDVYYNISQYDDANEEKLNAEVGPPVIHSYTFVNHGPSAVESINVLIAWPLLTSSGDDLLYLSEQPHLVGNIRCEAIDDIVNLESYVIKSHSVPSTSNEEHYNKNILNRQDNDNQSSSNTRKQEPLFNATRLETYLNIPSNALIYLIRCKIDELQKGQEANIALRSRINATTVENISKTQPIDIQSILVAETEKERSLHFRTITTTVMNTDTDYKALKGLKIIIPHYI